MHRILSHISFPWNKPDATIPPPNKRKSLDEPQAAFPSVAPEISSFGFPTTFAFQGKANTEDVDQKPTVPLTSGLSVDTSNMNAYNANHQVMFQGFPVVDAPKANTHVFEEGKISYDVLLNQRNPNVDVLLSQGLALELINAKARHKFYIIQLLEKDGGGEYWTWNRWGRVGEWGQHKLTPFGSNKMRAIQDFEKKFKEKTKNDWKVVSVNRDSFKTIPGKCTLVPQVVMFWTPQTHSKHPTCVKDAIICVLLIAKRERWPFDNSLMMKLFSHIAYRWLAPSPSEDAEDAARG